jgi:hypothetical protein
MSNPPRASASKKPIFLATMFIMKNDPSVSRSVEAHLKPDEKTAAAESA